MTITRLILATGLSLAVIIPLATTSAAAQSVIIDPGYRNDGYTHRGGYDDDTVVIRRHSNRGWHRGWDQRYSHRGWRDRGAYGMMNGCRMVTIRRQNDMGDTVIRRVRRCG